jgi:hypothetical protein
MANTDVRSGGLMEDRVLGVIDDARNLGLFPEESRCLLEQLFDDRFPFREAVGRASSLHIHMKCGDVDDLDVAAIVELGAEMERTSTGYVKYRAPNGVNLIYSSFPVAEDDLVDPSLAGRPLFVDHLGIDLRELSDRVQKIFDAIPTVAANAGWLCRYQGSPVFGCHAEVKEKFWVYPAEGPHDSGRPIEFPIGPLTLHDDYVGCDLRPIDPRHPLAAMAARATSNACGGNTTSSCGTATCG